jgi:hypothetical protein
VVILPPARLGDISRGDFLALREGALFEERLARLLERRRREARPRMDALLGFLSKLLDAAVRYEVRLALVPSGFPDEVPDAVEAEAALREFRGAPLGTWLDAARAAAGLDLDPAAGPRWERLAAAGEGATLGAEAAPALRAILDPPPVWAIDPPADGFEEALAAGRDLLERLDRGPGAESARGGILGP